MTLSRLDDLGGLALARSRLDLASRSCGSGPALSWLLGDGLGRGSQLVEGLDLLVEGLNCLELLVLLSLEGLDSRISARILAASLALLFEELGLLVEALLHALGNADGAPAALGAS